MIPDNIEAYIFDLDGTLIDSNGVWKEIDRLIFEKNNVSLSDTELNAACHELQRFSRISAVIWHCLYP